MKGIAVGNDLSSTDHSLFLTCNNKKKKYRKSLVHKPLTVYCTGGCLSRENFIQTDISVKSVLIMF